MTLNDQLQHTVSGRWGRALFFGLMMVVFACSVNVREAKALDIIRHYQGGDTSADGDWEGEFTSHF